jgi:hypothetical protein
MPGTLVPVLASVIWGTNLFITATYPGESKLGTQKRTYCFANEKSSNCSLTDTNREVAGRLHISVRTAEWHRASIRLKLDLASRAALVEFAFAHDLAQPGSTIGGRP